MDLSRRRREQVANILAIVLTFGLFILAVAMIA